MAYSIARTWREDKGLDIAIYAMYDAVELLKKETIVKYPEIKEAVDALLAGRRLRSTPVASAPGPASSRPMTTTRVCRSAIAISSTA